MAVVYPPPALLLTRHVGLSPAECLVVGAGVHFLYRRGPHLTPHHQVIGLAPTFFGETLKRLGLSFERHTCREVGAGIAALRNEVGAANRSVLVEMPDGLQEVTRAEANTLVLDDGIRCRTVDIDTFQATWFQAVPAGVWYAVAWQPVARPSASLLRQGLVQNAHAMLISSGAWQGVDGIEFWSEDLAAWPDDEEWPASAVHTATHIRETGCLWRQALAAALEQLAPAFPASFRGREKLESCLALWAEVADRLADAGTRADAGALLHVRSRVLRLAAAESRFWGHVLNTLERGAMKA